MSTAPFEPRASSSVLVVHARLITVAASADLPFHLDDGWMLVEDGVVSSIGSGTPPSVGEVPVLDAAGRYVAPGFVSSHSHLFTSGLRGLAADQPLYGWARSSMGATRFASPEDMYWATVHGSFDFLNAGVTTAFDFHDSREPWSDIVDGLKSSSDAPLRPVEHVLRQIDAKHDAGLRFVSATRPDSDVGTFEDVRARFAPTLEHLEGLNPRFALGGAVMGGVQWAENRDAARQEAALMREFGVINQAHFLETPEALDHQLTRFAWYEESGALGPDFIFGHFVHPTADIIARTAAAGAHMSWQATANGRLGSGVADIPALEAAGIEIGLGLDDQACSDLADPWQNMRMAAYSVRAAYRDATAISMRRVLEMQTIGAARIIGVDDRVGSLEPGKLADFVVVDPASPDIGPIRHPVDSYVLACGLRNLVGVFVGGQRVSDGRRPDSPLAAEATAQIAGRVTSFDVPT